MATGKFGLLEYQFGIFFRKVKSRVTGIHPYTNLMHPQWVMDSLLLAFAKKRLSVLPSNAIVLDVGCGHAPYWHLNRNVKWIGLDVNTDGKANVVIGPDGVFPIADNHVDYVLSTQVLEHVENYERMIEEIWRTLKPGGIIILNLPFLYPLHGLPNDYQRFTPTKLHRLFARFEIIEMGSIGGFGSSLATLVNNFWNDWTSTGVIQQLVGVLFWPLSLLTNLFFNLLGKLLDKFDVTERYCLNFFLLARKPI